MDSLINWLLLNWIETTAAALGLIGIFLQIKQNHWYWLTSIVMVLMYVVVFYKSGFYADMSFQFYYLIVSLYGWIYWFKSRGVRKIESIKTFKLNSKQWIVSILISVLFFFIIYFGLTTFTNSQVAAGDAFTTALSITATWLLARKILENWLFWIVVDAVSTGLYIYKGLYPSAILFFVLTLLAIVGYFKWKKTLLNE